MSKIFDPKSLNESSSDLRRDAPATGRNRDAILEVLKRHVSARGVAIEVASGSGQHASYFTRHLPDWIWHPTDIEDDHLASINAWAVHSGGAGLQPAQHFNVLEQDFQDLVPHTDIDLISAINLIHIAPWSVTEALMAKAGRALKTDAILFLYGPYKMAGQHVSPSNLEFDQSLQSRNPAWGVRNLDDVTKQATKHGFSEPVIAEMPANNLSLVFRKS